MKYNYKKASDLFQRYYDFVCDPWTLGEEEKQRERRFFMYTVTHKTEDIKIYTDYIKEEKHYVCEPYENAKSKCWDFDLMKQYDALIDEIVNFEN